jgi:lysophospholipase L1-like esterase
VDRLGRAIGLTCAGWLVFELLLRGAYSIRNSYVEQFPFYTIGYDYAPSPPWDENARGTEPDRKLFWRYRPNVNRRYIDIFGPVRTENERSSDLRSFVPFIPDSLLTNPMLQVSLNSKGFRDEDFPTKTVTSFRTLCLGDSWTFGWNVSQGQAFPQRLKALLRQEFPGADFEVLNLGVGGYSTYQGLELLKTIGLDLQPDVLVIAFAMNDGLLAGYRDKDIPRQKVPVSARFLRLLQMSESYKLLRYFFLLASHKPAAIATHLEGKAAAAGTPEEIWAGGAGLEKANYEDLEPWTRVSPKDYEANIREMIALARKQQISVILLYNQLWDTPYRMVLQKLSQSEGVPFVDGRALISDARKRLEQALEEKLKLRASDNHHKPATANGVETIFRVYSGTRLVSDSLYIVGPHPALGAMRPNTTAMYDDGSHGDQRSGDKVWSYSAKFPAGARVFYVYTNSGRSGEWEGLDVPEVREFSVDTTDEPLYRPIETFGELYMQADSLHTNASGYEVIARALLDVLKANEKARQSFRTYVKISE